MLNSILISWLLCYFSLYQSFEFFSLFANILILSKLLLFYSIESFSYQRSLMVFHWSLRDNKSPQVSKTLLCILADLNNAVVWMVSTRPLISKPSSPCIIHLVTVPSASITIGIIVTFMLHRLFTSLARSKYLLIFSLSFSFILWSIIR